MCKDDLVLLPKALCSKLGGIGPLVLVFKITNFVHIVDVNNMHTCEIDAVTYWKYLFNSLCGRERLTEFVVINIDYENDYHEFNVSKAAAKQRFKRVSVEVARKEDFGVNDETFIVNTHLGEVLNFNDTVLGFDLDQMNMTELEDLNKGVPPVVLVKKTYPKYRKLKKNKRNWKLKQLTKEHIDENNVHNKKDKQYNKNQRDYDLFL